MEVEMASDKAAACAALTGDSDGDQCDNKKDNGNFAVFPK